MLTNNELKTLLPVLELIEEHFNGIDVRVPITESSISLDIKISEFQGLPLFDYDKTDELFFDTGACLRFLIHAINSGIIGMKEEKETNNDLVEGNFDSVCHQ